MKLSYSTTPAEGGGTPSSRMLACPLHGANFQKGGIILRDLADETLILWGEPLGGSRISYFWAGAVGGNKASGKLCCTGFSVALRVSGGSSRVSEERLWAEAKRRHVYDFSCLGAAVWIPKPTCC
jgi:hypothetical protein